MSYLAMLNSKKLFYPDLKFQKLISFSLSTSIIKFHVDPFSSFYVKLLTDKKTDKQTNAGQYITSLTNVKYQQRKQLFVGFLTILTTQVMCREFSRCYNDVNICLWTDDSHWTLSQSVAQTACRERDSSFLPRVTNRNIQSKLADFRSAAKNLLHGQGFWIDVTAVGISSWHWVDKSQLAGQSMSMLV